MKIAATATKRSLTSKVVLTLSLLTAGYWALVMNVDVYRFAVVGVFYEILWLPMIAAIFVLPIVALVYWIIERFYLKSLYLYALLALLATVLIIVLQS
jgi:hypothetical protein